MKTWMWIVLGLVIIGGGVFLFSQTPTQAPQPQPGEGGGPGTLTPTKMEFKLDPINQDRFDQGGKATFEENNGKVTVRLELNKVDELNNQPAHIHSGSCPGVGDVLFPLNNVVDGKSVTEINTTLNQLKSQSPLALNVHKSDEEISIYTACGNLSQ